MNPQLRLFLCAIVLVGISGGIFETTFNNYLDDTFSIAADTRGMLEFPRELPGFLVAVLAGALFFLPETLVAAFAAFVVGLGMIGLALFGNGWGAMLCFMIVWSTGAHLMMPVRASISMDLAEESRRGRRLGQVAGAGVASAIIGCGLVWVVMRYLSADYRVTFAAGGVSALVAGCVLMAMRLPGAHLRRPKFIWRRRYWLYYVLAFLFGARKQVFITFGPWVLVKVFDQPAYIFAQLWIVSAVIGAFFQPALGRIIDRFGERKVLVADSLCVLLVCLGYGLSDRIGARSVALWVLYACYVVDHLLFGVNMARSTYLSKIAMESGHVAPTLSLGISINHAVSMSIPLLGGLLWVRHGHASVFYAAAGIAVLMFVFSLMVRTARAGTAASP